MASIWKLKNSPFFACQFKDATGKRITRSTKQRKHSDARKVAEAWESAADLARGHQLTRAASIQILDQLMRQEGLGTLEVITTSDYLRKWVQSGQRSKSTQRVYTAQIEAFIASMGERASAPLNSVTASEIEAWRDAEIAAGKAPQTVNAAVQSVASAFSAAIRKGLALSNPAAALDKLRATPSERERFTDEEIRKLLAVASVEWRSMILMGVHCGLRISDAANLKWASVSLENSLLSFWPSKTRRTATKPLEIALHAEVIESLAALPQGLGQAPIFPDLVGLKSGGYNGLSNRFKRVMRKAGIVSPRSEPREGEGRRTSSKTFHSLRHTMISRMADLGVSQDVRRSVAGHSSDKVHARYCHLSLDAQREAQSKMPRLA